MKNEVVCRESTKLRCSQEGEGCTQKRGVSIGGKRGFDTEKSDQKTETTLLPRRLPETKFWRPAGQ